MSQIDDEIRPLSPPSVGRYLLLRFARIWPVHAVLVLAGCGSTTPRSTRSR